MINIGRQQQSIIAIIPARWASSRFPGKPLADLCGKPLIQWIWEAACRSNLLDRIIIATDDERIAECAFDFGAEYAMTPSNLPSGTDRIIYALDELNETADIVLNIQGDEPLLNGKIIDSLLNAFTLSDTDVGTLVKRIYSKIELFDKSVVKVVLKSDNTALYFSRNVIPYIRDVDKDELLDKFQFWKHIGIYAYKTPSLRQFQSLSVSSLENAEKLEQLRLMECGAKFLCVETDAELIGVDTPADLENVKNIIQHNCLESHAFA